MKMGRHCFACPVPHEIQSRNLRARALSLIFKLFHAAWRAGQEFPSSIDKFVTEVLLNYIANEVTLSDNKTDCCETRGSYSNEDLILYLLSCDTV
jgi:hypothetical protein